MSNIEDALGENWFRATCREVIAALPRDSESLVAPHVPASEVADAAVRVVRHAAKTALVDAGLLATAPAREQIAERLRQRAIDDEAETVRLDEDDSLSAEDAARALYEWFYPEAWEGLTDGQRVYYRAIGEALELLGLLATDRPETFTEWGVTYGDGGPPVLMTDEARARRIAYPGQRSVVRREVTAWAEVG